MAEEDLREEVKLERPRSVKLVVRKEVVGRSLCDEDGMRSREGYVRLEDNRVDCSCCRSMANRASLDQRRRRREGSILVRIQWRKQWNEHRSIPAKNTKSRDDRRMVERDPCEI